MNKNQRISLHLIVATIIVIINIIVVWRLSNLDLFDFFNILFSMINLAFYAFLIISTSGIFALFVITSNINKKFADFEEKSNKNESQRSENNSNLREFMSDVKDSLRDTIIEIKELKLKVDNQLINNKELKEKLFVVLESIYVNRKYQVKNATFFRFAYALIEIIADTYSEMKRNESVLDLKTTIKLKDRFLNLLISGGIVIDISNITNEVDKLLQDFNLRKYTGKEKSKDIILDSSKTLLQAIYFEFIGEPQAQNQLKQVISNNNSKINGNNNSNMQDLKANTININLNK